MIFTVDLQFFGRGSSKAGGGTGGGAGAGGNAGGANTPQNQPSPTTSPSGITYDQFMQMSDAQKYQTINDIIFDPNIQVPSYLDGSQTSKLMYALGMNNKPTVVSDAQLDTMQGREIFRTVYNANSTVTSDMILDQIRNGDYTQMSGSGGSAHSRALYFATNFADSAAYGRYESNPMVMRAKLNPNARIRSETSLTRQMHSDVNWRNSQIARNAHYSDALSLYAIAHNVDGWYSSTYTMIVNRGNMTASSQNRRIGATASGNSSIVSNWNAAYIVP